MRGQRRVLLFLTMGACAALSWACGKADKAQKQAPAAPQAAPAKTADKPAEKPADKAQVVARLDLDAKGLAGLKTGSKTVNLDPFYKRKNPQFEGYPFDDVMALIPGIAGIDRERHSLRFVCADGYHTTFPFKAVENGDGVLATRLAGPSDRGGVPWDEIQRGKTKQTPAPYYLVWAGETDLKARPWPYQLVAIEVVANDALAAALSPPPGAKAEAGYELFRTYCFACHTVNLQGGKMGPELNVPQNIFEYRDAGQLKAFVKNPQSFRAASLMPPQALSDDKLEAVFGYLRAMAQRKICTTAADCAAKAATP